MNICTVHTEHTVYVLIVLVHVIDMSCSLDTQILCVCVQGTTDQRPLVCHFNQNVELRFLTPTPTGATAGLSGKVGQGALTLTGATAEYCSQDRQSREPFILLFLQGQQQRSQDRQSREPLIILFLQGQQRSSQDRQSRGALILLFLQGKKQRSHNRQSKGLFILSQGQQQNSQDQECIYSKAVMIVRVGSSSYSHTGATAE